MWCIYQSWLLLRKGRVIGVDQVQTHLLACKCESMESQLYQISLNIFEWAEAKSKWKSITDKFSTHVFLKHTAVNWIRIRDWVMKEKAKRTFSRSHVTCKIITRKSSLPQVMEMLNLDHKFLQTPHSCYIATTPYQHMFKTLVAVFRGRTGQWLLRKE